jgi:hypothetical protein
MYRLRSTACYGNRFARRGLATASFQSRSEAYRATQGKPAPIVVGTGFVMMWGIIISRLPIWKQLLFLPVIQKTAIFSDDILPFNTRYCRIMKHCFLESYFRPIFTHFF